MASDKNNINIKKEKQKATVKAYLRKMRIPIAILLVIGIIAVYYAAIGKVRRSNTADTFNAIPKTFGESAGYPYSEDVLALDKLMLIGDKPLVVSTTGVTVLSNDAAHLQDFHVDWADTRVASFNGRAFIYSNTACKAYLISRTKKLEDFEEKNPIKVACVGKDGTVAYSFAADNAQSVAKVFTPRGKLYFEWHCTKEYISSLALSDTGKKLVISAVGVNNAELYSRIILFKTSKKEADFDVKLPGTTVLRVFCSPAGKIVAVGDNRTVIFNGRGEKLTEITYADDALSYIDSDLKGSVLICYKEFGGSKIKVVTVPPSGKNLKEFELDYMPDSADIKGSKLAFVLGNEVIIYSTSGEKRSNYLCSGDVGTVLLSNSGIYTLENGSVCRYR